MKRLKASPLVMAPLAIIVTVALSLAVLYAFKGQRLQMTVILVLAFPLALIFIGWWRRQILWNEEGLEYRGILGTKKISWEEITEIRLFRAGLKKVLYLGSKDQVLIIPLIFSRQEELARAFREHLSLEKDLPQEEDLKLSFTETILLWTGAALLAIILATKILG